MNGSSANSWRPCLQARNGLGRQKQTSESSRILQRFVWYTGAGLLVSSIVALATRFWTPESMHLPLFVLTHSLIGGVVVFVLIRSFGKAKTGSTLHNISSANLGRDGGFRSGCFTTASTADLVTPPPCAAVRHVFPNHRIAPAGLTNPDANFGLRTAPWNVPWCT